MGKLYVCGTPIGNLGDFSARAVETLKNVNFIAAEDTRVTIKLLNKFNIKTELLSFHKFNEESRKEEIVNRILNGEDAALVTDAGMPAISDPGERLVSFCHKSGVEVVAVPGPTAFATAVAISGLYSGRICFEGFLSQNKKSRNEHLNEIKNYRETLVFYEAPHKLLNTLKSMYEIFGNRKIALVKEITKIHETVFNTDILQAIEFYSQNNPKGEYVLVIEGKKQEEKKEYTLSDAVALAKELKQEGNSAAFAAKQAATVTGLKKSDIYKKITELTE